MRTLNRLFCSTLFCATVLTAQTVWAATYYVDRNLPGNDGNAGTTEATAFLTIAKCVQMARNPGDTCLVKNGTYSEGVLMRYSGTAGNPITLKNYPGHRPLLRFSDRTNPTNRIELISISGLPNPIRYIVIEGLEITNAYNGVKFTAAENISLRRNHIHDTHYSPYLGSGYQVTIEGNRLYHTGIFTGCPPTCKQTHGIYLTGKGHIIKNNIIYDSVLYGVHAAAYPFNPAEMPNTNHAGFQALIVNNTIAYSGNRGGIAFWNAGAGTAQMLGNRVENNIFYENAQLCGSCGSAIDFVDAGAAAIRVANNVFYASGTGSTIFVAGGTAGSTYILSGNSTSANPKMANAPSTIPDSPDFHLTSESIAAIDRGLNLSADGVSTDIDGVSRGLVGGFDIGAYEFTGNLTSQAAPAAPANLRIQ